MEILGRADVGRLPVEAIVDQQRSVIAGDVDVAGVITADRMKGLALAAHVKLFLNLENLGNVRQSRWDPMLLPGRAVDGRWTVDAWAPLEGRVINGGVRFMF